MECCLCLPIVFIVKFTMENKRNKANWIIVYLPYIYRLCPGRLRSHPFHSLRERTHENSGVPKGGGGGNGGVQTPTLFKKVGPLDSHKNVIRLVGGGGDWADRAAMSRSGL